MVKPLKKAKLSVIQSRGDASMFLHVVVLLWRFNSATWLASAHCVSSHRALTFYIINSYFINGSLLLGCVQLTVIPGVSKYRRIIRFGT